MTTRIRGALACLVAGMVCAVPPAAAQGNNEVLQSAFEAVRSKQRFLVSGTLQFDPAEEKAFWPEYDRYEGVLHGLDQRSAKQLADFVAVQQAIHPATASALIDEHLAIETARLEALKAHVRALRPVLPAPKLARYVQLLNKVEISLGFDLAQRVPLLQ